MFEQYHLNTACFKLQKQHSSVQMERPLKESDFAGSYFEGTNFNI